MTDAAPVEFQLCVGRVRTLLSAAVHAIAAVSAIELAADWTAAWGFLGVVVLSAIDEGRCWSRERRCARTLALIPGGIAIDSIAHRARRAWLGPGWTAIWLTAANGRRRLLYVFRGEVTCAAHAALRRHAKSLELD